MTQQFSSTDHGSIFKLTVWVIAYGYGFNQHHCQPWQGAVFSKNKQTNKQAWEPSSRASSQSVGMSCEQCN